MANLEYVQKLMGELGPLVDEISLIQQAGDDRWLVVFNEQTGVEIECDETGNKLVFSMPLGPVHSDDREQVYESMLAYNLLYHDTAGMRLAMEGPGENVVLLLDMCHLDLQPSTLAAFLEVFVTTGLGWRDVLSSNPASESAVNSEDLSGALQA